MVSSFIEPRQPRNSPPHSLRWPRMSGINRLSVSWSSSSPGQAGRRGSTSNETGTNRLMRRGEVWSVRLDPVLGSEPVGARPAVILSNDVINANSPVVVVVPFTTYRSGDRVYPSQCLIQPRANGLEVTSVALGDQVR